MSAMLDAPTWERAALVGKYLTFRLDNEQFGVQLLRVREIIGLMPTTTVPGAPPEIRGILNLRGKIIPVMDLRLRFGMGEAECSDRACIIVTEIRQQDRFIEIGLLVDGVSEVLNVTTADIEPPPEFGVQVDTSYILGLAKSEHGVKVLLDVDHVVLQSALQHLEPPVSPFAPRKDA